MPVKFVLVLVQHSTYCLLMLEAHRDGEAC